MPATHHRITNAFSESVIHYDVSIQCPDKRGPVLNGVLFRSEENRSADTVMIAITGIHGNFYSNPFYYNIGDTLNSDNIDFIYAQTNDAFGQMETGQCELRKERDHRFVE